VGTATYTISTAAATPPFNPVGGTYSGTQSVVISDTTTGASIFYTLDGSTPATSVGGSTKQYSAGTPISVTATETINAIATATGFSSSAVGTATYTISTAAATPVITPATGTYTGSQTVTITDSTPGATIYYTLDGSTPATSVGGSTKQYSASTPISVTATETINAIATATNFATSATATSIITISTGGAATINFGSGFSAAGLQFNGHTKLNGTRLQLTDTSTTSEAASAFWTAPVNVQTFTNDFTFQLTNPAADGFTFTIQNAGVTALGGTGGLLGYAGATKITPSVAVKFDLSNNAGEGNNSTGLYTNGAAPNVPATTFGGGVNLHSGDTFQVHMTYDGTTLTLTITDTVVPANTFTTSWPINIPTTVGANTALVGFTAGTGGLVATQEILTWSYSNP
jgi:Legume lectin domain/Chitobiase/beta-hexosaminidase C-terminal domain